MKLLMFNTKEFWYKTYCKSLDGIDEIQKEEKIKDVLVIFVNVEKGDEEKSIKIVRKTVDNVKWLAKKTDRKKSCYILLLIYQTANQVCQSALICR